MPVELRSPCQHGLVDARLLEGEANRLLFQSQTWRSTIRLTAGRHVRPSPAITADACLRVHIEEGV